MKILASNPIDTVSELDRVQLNTNGGRFTYLDADKLRGGYYTSEEVATWLVDWAIRSPSDTILEPSCGDGVFLDAAACRLATLGASAHAISNALTGIEINPDEADRARLRLNSIVGLAGNTIVETGDFFDWWQQPDHPAVDAVIGNPPFIRYQAFPEPHRSRAMKIMAKLGFTPNRLTNIWVPFVAAAVASLRPGGRIALVLPAELLQVSYASQLRSFLIKRFASISIVACNELFFEKAEQEVVLLLADGARDEADDNVVCQVALTETRSVNEVTSRSPAIVLAGASPKVVHHDSEKWLKYFLTACEIEFMRDLRTAAEVTELKTHASVDVGVVTGKNEFFVLTGKQLTDLGINPYAIPIISRSAQLKGARIPTTEWQELSDAGDRVHLLHLTPANWENLTEPLADYIRSGEARSVHTGYKCSIRPNWYAVPSVWIPDGFLFRQIYDFPRMVLNQAQATSTDTIHRVKCTADPERVMANVYTYLTAASTEIEGRSYGGGVLELEPTEAERLLVPSNLQAALPLDECDRLIRAGRLDDILKENDRLVLMGIMGMDRNDCAMLRGIWTKMRDRRLARRRKGKIKVAAEVSL